MVSPAPVNPPMPIPRGARTASRFLRTFGFHVLAVLLGIALAFM
jgi:hypothetical protein